MSERKITPPEWLTVSYIEKAMQQGLKDTNLKIKSCDISPATAVGDNYLSTMLRLRLMVQTNGKEVDVSVVVKVPLETTFEKQEDIAIFRREIKMLTKTVPALSNILRKVYPEQENLSAVCYHQEQDPGNITCIFVEDLRQSGFTMANRFTGLDWDHTSLVLRSLAKFHASSLIHVEQDPDPISLYDFYFWESPAGKNVIKGIYEKPVRVIAKMIGKWENFPKKDVYVKKMEDLEGKIVDKLLENLKRDEGKLNVICHGDCWVNNMMFRYDEKNKVNGIRFLDFQTSNYNSPVFDFMYFVFSSAQSRFTDVDPLLSVYHETFVATLDSLKYHLKKPFTLEMLKKEFHDHLFFGLATVLGVIPIITVPPSKVVKLDAILDNDSSESDRMYDREEYIDILKEALPYFEKNGVF